MTLAPARAALVLTAVLAVAGALLPPLPLTAASAAPAPRTAPRTHLSAKAADVRIAAKLKVRLKDRALGKDVAIRVYDPARGATVYTSQSLEGQLPASNMKVITATTALTVLGPSTRLPTRVVLDPSGDIVLIGGGDPLLSSRDLDTLAARTVAALAARAPEVVVPRRVTLRVDDRLFPAPTRAKGWTSSYGLGTVSPVRALVRYGHASADTSSDAATYFAKALKAAGTTATYGGRTSSSGGPEIARLAGHRIEDDVRVMLARSDNQIAETLFRQVALRMGYPATWAGSAAAARAFLAKARVPLGHVTLVDGSGLSRSNRLTAKALVKVLQRSENGRHPTLASLIPSLPVAGRTGTLVNRFRTAPTKCARGAIHAKTGYINDVVSLSGVATGADGRPRVFSIVANHLPSSRYSVAATQRAVDKLAATITGCY